MVHHRSHYARNCPDCLLLSSKFCLLHHPSTVWCRRGGCFVLARGRQRRLSGELAAWFLRRRRRIVLDVVDHRVGWIFLQSSSPDDNVILRQGLPHVGVLVLSAAAARLVGHTVTAVRSTPTTGKPRAGGFHRVLLGGGRLQQVDGRGTETYVRFTSDRRPQTLSPAHAFKSFGLL